MWHYCPQDTFYTTFLKIVVEVKALEQPHLQTIVGVSKGMLPAIPYSKNPHFVSAEFHGHHSTVTRMRGESQHPQFFSGFLTVESVCQSSNIADCCSALQKYSCRSASSLNFAHQSHVHLVFEVEVDAIMPVWKSRSTCKGVVLLTVVRDIINIKRKYGTMN